MRSRRGELLASGALLVALAALGLPTATGVTQQSDQVLVQQLADRATWSLDRSLTRSQLSDPDADHATHDVVALSDDDVWAVGSYDPPDLPSRAWARHWDGTSWSQVHTPDLPGGDFSGIAAISEQDVWAVGDFDARDGSGFGDVLVEHWDGHQWRRVFAPRPGGFSVLHAVDGTAPDDVWGVGIGRRCLTEHWDGTVWRVVPDASPRTGFCDLFGVTALSSHDVYAVGVLDRTGYQPFIEHWDGSAWTRQETVGAPPDTYFLSVDADPDGNVWAVGVTRGDIDTAAVARLDGDTWTYQDAAPPGDSTSWTRGIAAIGPSDVWIVGFQSGIGEPRTALTEHWNGSRWKVIPTPRRSKATDDLGGISALGPDDIFAGGAFAVHDKLRALEEHWNGTEWTILR